MRPVGRRVLGGLAGVTALLVSVPLGGLAVGGPARSTLQETAINQCKHGGWHTLTDGQGVPFRDQGQCVTWAIHHWSASETSLVRSRGGKY